MADQITFRGVTLLDMDTNGASWDFQPGGPPRVVSVTVKAQQGDGHWIKRAGRDPSRHVLTVTWNSTVAAVTAILASVNTHLLGALVVPDHGTFTNCQLAGWTELKPAKHSEGYLIDSTLTFLEFP